MQLYIYEKYVCMCFSSECRIDGTTVAVTEEQRTLITYCQRGAMKTDLQEQDK